VYPV